MLNTTIHYRRISRGLLGLLVAGLVAIGAPNSSHAFFGESGLVLTSTLSQTADGRVYFSFTTDKNFTDCSGNSGQIHQAVVYRDANPNWFEACMLLATTAGATKHPVSLLFQRFNGECILAAIDFYSR